MVMSEMLELIGRAASIIAAFILLVLFLRGFCLIRASQVGILTKNMLGKKNARRTNHRASWASRGSGEDVDAGALLEAAYHLVICKSSGRDGRYRQYRHRRID